MKVDKRKPLHWLWLGLFSLNTLLSVVIRLFVKSPTEVVLYGHKLNGNLKAIYKESDCHEGLVPYYLSMDYGYCRELKNTGVNVVWGGSGAAILILARAKIIVSDHGLHCLILLLKFTGIKFIDVWHGIPFKGFDKDDFKVQRQYDETWVTSPYMAKLYEEKFGFQRDKIKIIGYARTDMLVKQCEEGGIELRAQLGLPSDKTPVVLFAPTWAQDVSGRNIYPFDCEELEFFNFLNSIALECDCVFLMRRHINSVGKICNEYQRVKEVPYDSYPDTETLLLISDVLIYDWSSIVFDFLLLNRLVICLDVVAPFKKGFSIDPSYRFGIVASDLSQLKKEITRVIRDYDILIASERGCREKILRTVYDEYADGLASERACGRLLNVLGGE
ncbi:MAG: CDP-glycerol glycerophosphotransferase family protein [Bacteroidota bacterium]